MPCLFYNLLFNNRFEVFPLSVKHAVEVVRKGHLEKEIIAIIKGHIFARMFDYPSIGHREQIIVSVQEKSTVAIDSSENIKGMLVGRIVMTLVTETYIKRE